MDKAGLHEICDMGHYNEVIRGYLIAAMDNAGFSREDIEKALTGMKYAFDDMTAAEAEQLYQKF